MNDDTEIDTSGTDAQGQVEVPAQPARKPYRSPSLQELGVLDGTRGGSTPFSFETVGIYHS